jgi:hypothetical protein
LGGQGPTAKKLAVWSFAVVSGSAAAAPDQSEQRIGWPGSHEELLVPGVAPSGFFRRVHDVLALGRSEIGRFQEAVEALFLLRG